MTREVLYPRLIAALEKQDFRVPRDQLYDTPNYIHDIKAMRVISDIVMYKIGWGPWVLPAVVEIDKPSPGEMRNVFDRFADQMRAFGKKTLPSPTVSFGTGQRSAMDA